MTQLERVTGGDLRRVAELANLELTSQEEASMLRDLNSILDHVAQLNEIDTSAVPAMAQVSEVIGGTRDSAAVLRDDQVMPSLNRSLVMSSAPDSDQAFFRVPKVIER